MNSLSVLGFQLEKVVSKVLYHYHLKFLTENMIKRRYGSSYNGIDHLFEHHDKLYMIQEKWRDTQSQKDASQFIATGNKLHQTFFKDRLPVYIWVSKNKPSKNSKEHLDFVDCIYVCEDTDIEILGIKFGKKISEIIGVNFDMLDLTKTITTEFDPSFVSTKEKNIPNFEPGNFLPEPISFPQQ